MKRTILCLVSCVASFAFGGVIREIAIPSESMGKEIPASVILPDSYSANPTNRWPVVYILHGAGGTHRRYIDANLGLLDLADRFQVILVCADGGKTSWWFDSPVDSSFRYETHVAKELEPWIDAHYQTLPRPFAVAFVVAGKSVVAHRCEDSTALKTVI